MQNNFFLALILLPGLASATCPPLKVGDLTATFAVDHLQISTSDAKGDAGVSLPDTARGECLSLKAVESSETLAELKYTSGENGTSTLVEDIYFTIVDIKQKKILFDPIDLERTIRHKKKTSHDTLATIEWIKKDGKQILQCTDSETKDVKQLWP